MSPVLNSTAGPARAMGWMSAAGLVVANIIGVGIFTTTGYQAESLGHPGLILLLWVVGGVLAFCGALCYAELGAALPRQGAEYAYLTETLGPAFGFMSAFVSLVAGFSAPIAAAAKGFTAYGSHFFPALEDSPAIGNAVAIALIWMIAGVQLARARGAVRFNDAVTLVKVAGILAVIVAGFMSGQGEFKNLAFVAPRYEAMNPGEIWTALGTSMIFVMFCYSGWNAAAYVAEEIHEPQRNLPRSLLLGTMLVVGLYVALNVTYFLGANVEELAGKPQVGLVAATHLLGRAGTSALTMVVLISLVASISAMTIAGPRVYFALGRDCSWLAFLGRVQGKSGTPAMALLLQAIVTTAVICSGRIDQIMQYAGFTLSLFASLAVMCVIVLRIQRPELTRPFRVPFYPLPPLLFLAVMAWTMYWSFQGRPVESAVGLLTVLTGGAIYSISIRTKRIKG